MRQANAGMTRRVFLTRRYAIKVPRLRHGWRNFLNGLLGNMQEADMSSMRTPELCPVVWAMPGGFFLIMLRAEPLTDSEWEGFDACRFCSRPTYEVPAENKQDSYGKLDGRIVAVDYGS